MKRPFAAPGFGWVLAVIGLVIAVLAFLVPAIAATPNLLLILAVLAFLAILLSRSSSRQAHWWRGVCDAPRPFPSLLTSQCWYWHPAVNRRDQGPIPWWAARDALTSIQTYRPLGTYVAGLQKADRREQRTVCSPAERAVHRQLREVAQSGLEPQSRKLIASKTRTRVRIPPSLQTRSCVLVLDGSA